jgi:hypothetical protein
VFHLAEVGQQLARQLLELLEAVLDRRVVQQRHVAGQHAGDLGVERVALLRNSSTRLMGSASVPALICSSSANSVSRRDSVPTKGRSVSDSSQAMAFSVAGVRSNCASSVPGL